MKMKPVGDHLLLKKQGGQEKTKSGIILTATNDAYGYADVIAVGTGLYTQTGNKIPMICKEGDVVLAPVSKLSGKNGNEVKLDGEKYILVREADIVMVSDNS
tara:strand:- start:1173 stop:1478 length:306 start_codon:yes stop_codon:yes gene_type:complete